MRITARAMVAATVATLGGMLLLTGCAGGGPGLNWRGPGQGQPSESPKPVASFATLTDGATDVSTATELALTGKDAATATVTLTDAAGATIPGALRADGSAWIPATQLQYSTSYTATLSTGPKISFTTMAKPSKTVNVSTVLSDGKVYGVGMPIVVRFGSQIPAAQRAEVERRLLVTSDPPQVGAWHWFNGGEVHFRPKVYWQAGTKLSVRLATGGLKLTANAYGAKDVTVNASIGKKLVMTTDNATKTMTVTENDQVVKTMPVSLGKNSTPSSSGAMVVMTKNQSELFVSDDPADPYRMTVYWTLRTTTRGEYIHAAPWSVGDQGKRNVSHGCTNVSTENAKWLYHNAQIGDPVVVIGTTRKLAWGNGWTDWDRSWEEYLKGSALPPPAETASPSPSTSPATTPSGTTPSASGSASPSTD